MDFSKLASLTPEKFFGEITKSSKQLVVAEKRGKVPESIDFSVQEVCCVCGNAVQPPNKPLRCASCQAPIYCSRSCATTDWKQVRMRNFPTHKTLCPINKRHMEKRKEADDLVLAFPWGRLEKDRTFCFDIARGRFGVLGGTGTGYWSHRGGPIPHSNIGDLKTMVAGSPIEGKLLKAFEAFNHLDGVDLLKETHLNDTQGWKLDDKLIPHLAFSDPSNRPDLVTHELGDWDAWYKWRKIPKESPAALLMSFPMSVYRMLVHCLEVTNPNAGSPRKRIPLNVHMIGAEVELNYLPLFSELALLLPYHDICLVLFGSGAHSLMQKAKSKPGSIAGKSSLSIPVYEYSAPKECGSGKISIFIYGDSEIWSEAADQLPTAFVACNAGLGSYQAWFPLIKLAHQADIPFAVTEYAEQSAEFQRGNFDMIVGHFKRPMEEYKIELNPFHQPGQRPIPSYRLPNLVNGFTMVVAKNASPNILVQKMAEMEIGGMQIGELD